jgi:hypothetical protein
MIHFYSLITACNAMILKKQRFLIKKLHCGHRAVVINFCTTTKGCWAIAMQAVVTIADLALMERYCGVGGGDGSRAYSTDKTVIFDSGYIMPAD